MLSKISPTCTPNVGEARAAQLACTLATNLSFEQFILKGDSKVVVHTLQNLNSIRDWRISSVILNILDSIPISSIWEAKKNKRSVNFYAHSVARWAAARSHSGSILVSSIPSLLSSPVRGDDSYPVCLL